MIDYTLPLEQLPDPLPIEVLRKPFDVTITPPGSKSITCRAYVLAALAHGESRIIRPLRADDTEYLLKALCMLGAEARWVPGEGHDGEDVLIKGVGGRFPRGGNLYMGDGGAPTRFMIACACLAAEPVVIDASPRMRERPIAEGVEMLRQLGAKIEYVEEEGRLPVAVVPPWRPMGGAIEVPLTESSQFISAILLISPSLGGETVLKYGGIVTSEPYINMTVRILRDWGAVVQTHSLLETPIGHGVSPSQINAKEFEIEPDASSAAYWWVAAAVCAGSRALVAHLDFDSPQPDVHVFSTLERERLTKASFDRRAPLIAVGGDRRERLSLWGMPLGVSSMPDGAIALAIYAATVNHRCERDSADEQALSTMASLQKRFAGKDPDQLRHIVSDLKQFPLTTRMTGLRTLRVKETDRIAALANELRKVGCTVETGEDWIEITPPPEAQKGGVVPGDSLEPRGRAKDSERGSAGAVPRHPEIRDAERRGTNPVIIETYNDHRMAMAFAVLGLVRPGISIRNPACVKKSYPTFWKDFAKLYQ